MNETSEEEIVGTMLGEYDGDEADIRADAADVIALGRRSGAGQRSLRRLRGPRIYLWLTTSEGRSHNATAPHLA